MTKSERNVIIKVHRRLVRRRCRSGLLRARLRAAAELIATLRLLWLTPTALRLTTTDIATCRSATTLTTTQHLHGAANVHHDFCGVAILTGLMVHLRVRS